MAQLKLTEKAIAKMPAPDPSGKQVLHWDTELKGFAVLCSGVSNARTFIVQRTLPSGKTRRLTVGAVNELALIAARDRAADMLDSLRRGIDPKVKVITPTLRWALEDYLAARKDLRPASVRLYRQIEHKLEAWLDTPLIEITGDMVETRHRAIATEIADDATRYTGTGTANATMRTFRILWNHAGRAFSRSTAEPGAPVTTTMVCPTTTDADGAGRRHAKVLSSRARVTEPGGMRLVLVDVVYRHAQDRSRVVALERYRSGAASHPRACCDHQVWPQYGFANVRFCLRPAGEASCAG